MKISSVLSIYVPLTLIAMLVAFGGWFFFAKSESRQIEPGSSEYEEYTHAFQVGLAALDSDLLPQAEENLTRCTQLLPSEPAAWANLGLLYLRSGRLDESEKTLLFAQELDPKSRPIKKLVAHLRAQQGQYDECAALLRQLVEDDPQDVRSLYQLVGVLDQQNASSVEQDKMKLLDQLISIEPQNSRLLVDKLKLGFRTQQASAIESSVSPLDQLKTNWQPRTVKAWDELKQQLAQQPPPANQTPLIRFTNTLLAEPSYLRDSARLETPDAFIGQAIDDYLWLPSIPREPAVADTQLTFVRQPLNTKINDGPCQVIAPFWATSSSQLSLITVQDKALHIDEVKLDVSEAKIPTKPAQMVCVDADNDLFTDLLIASDNGLQLFHSQDAKAYIDVTAEMQLSDDIVAGSYLGGCAVDFDLDGDLDVMLHVKDAAPIVLRNNFDKSFTVSKPFTDASDSIATTWGDFDSDGANDVAWLDARQQLHVFSNQRSGKFVPWQTAPPADTYSAVTSFDATSDGQVDIVALSSTGQLVALFDSGKQSPWGTVNLNDSPTASDTLAGLEGARLIEADFDNNGALDVLLASEPRSQIWLSEPQGRFKTISAALTGSILDVSELDGDGRIDLLAIDDSGKPAQWKNAGEKSYGWLDIRPQASRGKVDGDNRINSFGIGGTCELRAGSLIALHPIRSPSVHLGLGTNQQADVVRMLWPNGTFQYEFTPATGESVVAVQRLKGSCPFLFAWDGQQFQFVTDFMWSTPLGMFINASDKGGFLQTTDWVKVPAGQMHSSDGVYELRVNANLWETHFFDHLSLKAVDHPAEVQLVIDEKFFLEPSTPKLNWVSTPQAIKRVIDHHGQDVSQTLAAVDGQYLDLGQRGRYQGLMDEHWIEFWLPQADNQKAQWLLARGWIHPTDSSVNYAIAQGDHPIPHGLVLEVESADGQWVTVNDRLGFPAGKNKTVIIPLDISGQTTNSVSGSTGHYRLRTNLEIYWDWMAVAAPIVPQTHRELPVEMISAELRVRGIVDMIQASPSSPELPVYDQLVSRGQYWRDLIGYHTRPGDILELIEKVDDRYAILSAGDEVILRFKQPPDVPDGWVRDFVWASDGWVKDGDLNTRYGKTVLPLPYHEMSEYVGDPDQLENDPVYQRFSKDWEVYHTRYIETTQFDRGLRRFQTYRPKDLDQ